MYEKKKQINNTRFTYYSDGSLYTEGASNYAGFSDTEVKELIEFLSKVPTVPVFGTFEKTTTVMVPKTEKVQKSGEIEVGDEGRYKGSQKWWEVAEVQPGEIRFKVDKNFTRIDALVFRKKGDK
jgi:hypothetical protein